MTLLLLLVACNGWTTPASNAPASNAPASNAPADADDAEDASGALPVLGTVPPFALTDSTGASVTADHFRDKVWVADFMFTSCPDVCPLLSAHMAEVAAHYAAQDRVRMVSFSVDPTTDTPPVLAAYAARFNADTKRWSFLTGSMDALKSVVVDGFKMELERVERGPEPALVLHGERFVVVDGAGRIRAYPDPKEQGLTGIYAAVDALLAE